MRTPSGFAYPDQRSTFDILLRSGSPRDTPVVVEHVRTSSGYNTSPLERHVVGLHLGAPVQIAHWRDQTERLHRFRPGDVLFTPAGSPVHYAHPDPVEALYIALDPAYLSATLTPMGVPTEQLVLCDHFGTPDVTIAAIGGAVLKELQVPGVGSPLYLEALMVQLIVHLVRRFAAGTGVATSQDGAEPRAWHARLRPAIDYIHAHYTEDISLADLAAVVHLTPSYFSRLFKRAYDVSPHQYVIQQRVAAAADLLNHTRHTVTEIASIVGFADHSHLSRHYKRLTGTTPRA